MTRVFEFLNRIAFTIAGHEYTYGQLLIVPTLLFISYLLAHWLARIISRNLAKRGVNPDLIHLVRRIFYVVIVAAVVITILDFINVPLTAFAFLSGAIAIGIGFGAQNIINNFISGWILMWERPIRIGDFLEIGDAKGTVETINTRSTRIRRTDGVHMLIPNSALLENTVVNWTLIDRLSRSVVRVGIAYGSSAKIATELLLDIARENPAILDDPAPAVFFEDFGDNALIFDLYFWVQANVDKDLRKVRSDVRYRIDEAFAENNIVIAYPQRDLHVDGAITVLSDKPSSGDRSTP